MFVPTASHTAVDTHNIFSQEPVRLTIPAIGMRLPKAAGSLLCHKLGVIRMVACFINLAFQTPLRVRQPPTTTTSECVPLATSLIQLPGHAPCIHSLSAYTSPPPAAAVSRLLRRLTASLLSSGRPQMRVASGWGQFTTFGGSVPLRRPLYWSWHPSTESSHDPNSPSAAERGTTRQVTVHTPPANGGKSAQATHCTAPRKRPPATLAPRPTADTPPLVPAGTTRRVSTWRGGAWERMPSSEAHVSAMQQA